MECTWVVDAQRDFMEPSGRLYVHNLFDESDAGASSVEDAIARVVAKGRERGDLVVYTGDWHRDSDEEIDFVDPSPERGTYPPHCMGGSEDESMAEGAELVAAAGIRNATILRRDAVLGEGRRALKDALRRGEDVFIEKFKFSVFEGNACTGEFVSAMRSNGITQVRVCGVARDVCVAQAVEGLLAAGMRVTVVRDAIAGLGLEGEDVTLGRWVGLGADITSSESLEVGVDNGRVRSQ